ncbi:hypothetical protein BD779DRAFT_1039051 [Infundibulicybe gibba]|nr:hypothetical protein BD779DRAFT_1039051 [Infundibulicybe gibba]
MAAMIKRSGTVPLSFVISGRAEVSAMKMSLVVNNMHRFKSLDLDVPQTRAHSDSEFFEAFSQPVPLLQSLTISNYANSNFAFPLKFLGGSAPNLRYMKLSTNSHIPWDSGLFAHLTTLDVSRPGKHGFGNPPSLRMLLSALARMPGLEILILRCCLSPFAPPRRWVPMLICQISGGWR